MKNKQKNYLIIPADEVKDITNLDTPLSDAFTNNHVSKKHQKIILKLAIDDIAYELVTHKEYFFEGSLIKTILSFDKDKKIAILSNNTRIFIHPKFVTINEVKDFYNDIILADEASDYEKSVKEVLLDSKKVPFSKRKVKADR